MEMGNKIKLAYIFEPYPIFYQPYITHLIDKIGQHENIDLSLKAFQDVGGKTEDVEFFPNHRRNIYKLPYLFSKYYKKLTYPEIRMLKYDIIHLQHSFLFTKIAALLMLPKAEKPKIIITLRGSDTYIKPWISQEWIDFYKKGSENVDAFITMSHHQKKYLQKWDVPAHKIHVIPISLSETTTAMARNPNAKELKIVSIFRMQWEKNIDGNLRLIQELKSIGIPVKYDIYGDGRDIGQLFYLIDKYNLGNCVTIHGRKENELIKANLPKYDFILQLSHSESLGMTVIEAQACGVPGIVSDVGGLVEIIKDGENGIVVKNNDIGYAVNSIIKLWQSRESYYKKSENAIVNAKENFNLNREADKLIGLYQNLLKK